MEDDIGWQTLGAGAGPATRIERAVVYVEGWVVPQLARAPVLVMPLSAFGLLWEIYLGSVGSRVNTLLTALAVGLPLALALGTLSAATRGNVLMRWPELYAFLSALVRPEVRAFRERVCVFALRFARRDERRYAAALQFGLSVSECRRLARWAKVVGYAALVVIGVWTLGWLAYTIHAFGLLTSNRRVAGEGFALVAWLVPVFVIEPLADLLAWEHWVKPHVEARTGYTVGEVMRHAGFRRTLGVWKPMSPADQKPKTPAPDNSMR